MSTTTCKVCGGNAAKHCETVFARNKSLHDSWNERDRLLAENARLREALREADSALRCGECADGCAICSLHGDPHEKIRAALAESERR